MNFIERFRSGESCGPGQGYGVFQHAGVGCNVSFIEKYILANSEADFREDWYFPLGAGNHGACIHRITIATMIQEWINKAFHISDAQSAPIIITLMVFITGGFVRTISTLFKNITGRRIIRRQFYLLTEELAGAAILQGERYVLNTRNLTSDGLKPISLSIVDFYEPGIFKDIGYARNFESIFVGLENRFWFRLWNRRKKIDAFHTCWRAFSSILFWQEKASQSQKEVLAYYNDSNDKRNTAMIRFEKLTYDLFKKLAGQPQAEGLKSYYRKLMDIKIEWGKLSNATAPNIANEHLVQPILAISMNSPLEEAQDIRFCLLDVESNYINIEKMMSVYTDQFLAYAEQMNHFAMDIVSGINNIKKVN